MCSCSLVARKGIPKSAPALAYWTRKTIENCQNLEKKFRVRVPESVVSVARKLNTIAKGCQDQNCLLRRGDCRNKGQNPETVLGLRPGEDGFVARKLNTIENGDKTRMFCFRGKITGTNVISQNSSLCSSHGDYGRIVEHFSGICT
jgi:hypothetical protein